MVYARKFLSFFVHHWKMRHHITFYEFHPKIGYYRFTNKITTTINTIKNRFASDKIKFLFIVASLFIFRIENKERAEAKEMWRRIFLCTRSNIRCSSTRKKQQNKKH